MRHFARFSTICTIGKKVKNTLTGVILLVKLQAETSNFIGSTRHHRCFSRFLNLASHGKVHYLWPTELSKSFSQLIMSIFVFPQYFFQQILPGGKVWGYPVLLISRFINFKLQKRCQFTQSITNIQRESYFLWKFDLGLEYFTQTFQYKFKVSRKHREKIERKNNMPVFTFHLSVAFFVILNPITPNFLIKQKPIN